MKNIEVVAAIIEHENRILCCQREGHQLSYLSEKWEFPGGKVEEGETREQALVREIEEELELRIYDVTYAITVNHAYHDFLLTMHAFHAGVARAQFRLHAHKRAVWAERKALNQFEWAAADIPIVEYLKHGYVHG